MERPPAAARAHQMLVERLKADIAIPLDQRSGVEVGMVPAAPRLAPHGDVPPLAGEVAEQSGFRAAGVGHRERVAQ